MKSSKPASVKPDRFTIARNAEVLVDLLHDGFWRLAVQLSGGPKAASIMSFGKRGS
jgi:hypothetical protein